MLDFRLTDEGVMVLSKFGDEASETLWELCYPELDELLTDEAVCCGPGGVRTLKDKARVAQAVQHERERMWNVPRSRVPAQAELGRERQMKLGVSADVADHYVKQVADRFLRIKFGSRSKIN